MKFTFYVPHFPTYAPYEIREFHLKKKSNGRRNKETTLAVNKVRFFKFKLNEIFELYFSGKNTRFLITKRVRTYYKTFALFN